MSQAPKLFYGKITQGNSAVSEASWKKLPTFLYSTATTPSQSTLSLSTTVFWVYRIVEETWLLTSEHLGLNPRFAIE